MKNQHAAALQQAEGQLAAKYERAEAAARAQHMADKAKSVLDVEAASHAKLVAMASNHEAALQTAVSAVEQHAANKIAAATEATLLAQRNAHAAAESKLVDMASEHEAALRQAVLAAEQNATDKVVEYPKENLQSRAPWGS